MSERPTIATPFALPCGAVLSNRVIKAPLTECLASAASNAPNARLVALYTRWAALTRAGALITGNIQVDRRWLEAPGNVVVEDERDMEVLRAWADGVQRGGVTKLIGQLSHAGRQCPISVTGLASPPAPSALPRVAQALPVFNASRAMAEGEIRDVIARFAAAARVLHAAGWAGVEVHAAHGYLISQFLSPRTNTRGDGWGGSLEGRARLLLEVVRAVRAATSPRFIIAVKLNSADFQRGGFSEDDAEAVVAALGREAVDLIDISGGNYEAAKMMEPVAAGAPAVVGRGAAATARTAAREAFFVEFAERIRRGSRLPLMLTGGIRSLACMQALVGGGTVDLIGLGRPFATSPRLVAVMLAAAAADTSGGDDGAGLVFPSPAFGLGVKAFEAAEQNLCHQACMRDIADGREPDTVFPRRRVLGLVLAGSVPVYVWSPGKSGPLGWSVVAGLLAATLAGVSRLLIG